LQYKIILALLDKFIIMLCVYLIKKYAKIQVDISIGDMLVIHKHWLVSWKYKSVQMFCNFIARSKKIKTWSHVVNDYLVCCSFSKLSRQSLRSGISKHGVDTITFDTGFGFGPGLPFDDTSLRRHLRKYNRWVLRAQKHARCTQRLRACYFDSWLMIGLKRVPTSKLDRCCLVAFKLIYKRKVPRYFLRVIKIIKIKSVFSDEVLK